MIKVTLIGSDRKILEKLKLFLSVKKYELCFIMINTIDYECLRKSEAVFLDNRINNSLKEDLIKFCLESSIELFIIPCLADILIKDQDLHLNDLLIRKSSAVVLNYFQKITKRLFDFLFSLLFIIILSPVMLLIYILIKLDDRGPALYLQKRLSYQQKEFVLYKFRTMVIEAEKKSGAVLSAENDERVTRVGRILRKTRLDEILQIFNVLTGEMSLVGPRPERKFFVDQFLQKNAFYKYRFAVKAGITGLAQIKCYYNSHYEDKLYHDLIYIANYSFWNDLKLIFKTVTVFFKKRSAIGINQEDWESLLTRKRKSLDEISPGIWKLRDIDEKDNYKL